MKTYNSGEFFPKKMWFLLQESHFFFTFTLQYEFLQKFWTIDAHDNEEFKMTHREKNLCEVYEGKVFLVFFASIFPDTMVIWMDNVLSDDAHWNIFKISEKNLA